MCLVVCRDPELLDVLHPALDAVSIGAQVCTEPDQAQNLLKSRKYDPIILDCSDLDRCGDILRSARATLANKDSVLIGIIAREAHMSDAFQMGVSLVLRKPMTDQTALRVLRTARALVTRMRRHFARRSLSTLAYVSVEGLSDHGVLLDLGEGGMAVQAHEALQPKQVLRLNFNVPESETALQATAEVVWADSSGRAGFRFIRLQEEARRCLREWLDTGSRPRLPLLPAPVEQGEREQFTAPFRLPPLLEWVLSAVLDGIIVLLAVALFGVTFILSNVMVPSPDRIVGIGVLLMLLYGAMYRYLFFPAPGGTPGSTLAKNIEGAYVEMVYRRKVDEFAADLAH